MMKRTTIVMIVTLLLACMTAHAEDTDKYQKLMSQAAQYTEDEEYEKAFAAYELARKLKPEDEMAYVYAADLYFELERYEEAEELVNQLLEIDPVSKDGWRLRCLIDLMLHDLKQLDEDIVFAEVSGADLKAYYQEIGDAYADAGDEEKAAVYYEAIFNAQTGIRNEKLDEAFKNGSIHFTETEYGGLFIDPTQYGAVIRSLSPTGNSALLWSEEERASYAVYDGNVVPIVPSDERGVEDIYGKREQMFESGLLEKWIGKEGVTWSHDGRYAVITSYRMAFSAMQYHDPLIIDTTTGEAFLPATWPKDLFEGEGAATAGTTCFSLDDRYLYFCQFGKVQEYLNSILRYDFISGETELCWTGEEDIYDPHIYETPDGALIILNTPLKKEQEYGICRFLPGKGGSYELEYIGSGQSLASCRALPRELWYSANSGYAVSKMESPEYTANGYDIFFQCYLPDQDFKGFDRLYAIPVDGGEIVEISNTDIETIEKKERIFSYYGVSLIRQSPDGYYALVLGRNKMSDTEKLFLINLEDMSFEEVNGLDAEMINISLIEREPVIEWNTDNLLIQTSDGVKTFMLE